MPRGANKIDLTGHVFGRWKVLNRSHNDGGHTHWDCRCECGTERAVKGSSLRGGSSTSCGCYQREDFGARSTSHGHSRTPIYAAWRAMVRRCHDPRSDEYCRYGVRGIEVCQRWRDSFPAFLEDMGERPFPKASIERIDNDGNYEPGNCRWATMKEQGQNRRSNNLVTFDGDTKTMAEWAQANGMAWNTLRYRLKRGWPLRDALFTQATKNKPHTIPR